MVQLEKNRFVILTEEKVPKHKLTEPKKYEDVKNLDNLAILVDKPYVVLDVDTEHEYLILKKILQAEKIKCRIMKTDKGGHFWFQNPKPLKNNTKYNTPITLIVDIRSWGKESYVKIKSHGEWREWVQWEDILDDIPVWLMPFKHDYKFLDSRNGDGRNSDLFMYIITLVNNGVKKADIKRIFKIINEYIFKDKLPAKELDTILRDEAFDNIRPAFFKGKEFKHDVFAHYLKNDSLIYLHNKRLYVYSDGYYSDSTDKIEKKMITYIPSLRSSQRKEVFDYLRLITESPNNASIYHIVAENGIIDIRDGSLQGYTPDIFVPNKITTSYEPGYYDKDVDRILDKITCNNREVRMLVEEMIGYCLLRTAKFQKAFILYGNGSNGKSTLLDMMISMLGDHNISSLSLKELNHEFKLSEITSKLVNIGDDISDEYMTDASIFKKLTTGEEITVNKKHVDPKPLRNTATMIFAANTMPKTLDKSNGMLRRLCIIPFNAVIADTDEDYDPFIIDKLITPEAKSYLLNLAISGIQRVFKKNKFTEPLSVTNMIKEYERDNNNVLQFIDEIDIIDKDSAETYGEYKYWCIENGVAHYNIRKFNTEVRLHTNLELCIMKKDGRSAQIWQNKST